MADLAYPKLMPKIWLAKQKSKAVVNATNIYIRIFFQHDAHNLCSKISIMSVQITSYTDALYTILRRDKNHNNNRLSWHGHILRKQEIARCEKMY